MSSSTSESQPPAARLAFTSGTLIAVGIWACLFALFIVLGLQS